MVPTLTILLFLVASFFFWQIALSLKKSSYVNPTFLYNKHNAGKDRDKNGITIDKLAA